MQISGLRGLGFYELKDMKGQGNLPLGIIETGVLIENFKRCIYGYEIIRRLRVLAVYSYSKDRPVTVVKWNAGLFCRDVKGEPLVNES